MASQEVNPDTIGAVVAKGEKEQPTKAILGGSIYDYPFEEAKDTILGTPENTAMIENFNTVPSARRYVEAIDRALSANERFKKETARYQQAAATPIAGSPISVSMTPAIERPQLHPYAAWLSSRGSNRGEIISTIQRERDRAKFIYERLVEKNAFEGIYSDFEMMNYPKSHLAKYLLDKGYLRDENEFKFFVDNAENKYSRHYGTSVFDMMWQKASDDGKAKTVEPMTLMMRMANGYRLKPNSEKDRKLYEAAMNDMDSSSFAEIGVRAFDALGHLGSAFVGTFAETGKSLVNPEWEFNEGWDTERGLSADDIKLKRDFIAQYTELIKQYRSGEIYSGDVDTTILKYANASNVDAAALEAAEWNILDPIESRTKNAEQVEKFMALWRQLDKKGALKHDAPGLNALASNIDAVFTATAGWLNLFAGTDPNSFTNGLYGRGYAAYFELFGDEPMSPTIGDAIIKGKMRASNYSADWQELHRSWMVNGSPLINALPGDLPNQLKDKSIIENTSQWADVFVASALAKGVTKALLRGAGGEAFGKLRFGQTSTAIESQKALVNEIARKGVELPADVKGVIEGIKRVAADAGETIDDYQAVERMFSGKAKYYDPVAKAVVDVPKGVIDSTRSSIIDRLNNVNAARRQMAAVVKESRRVKYSPEAVETVDMLRKQLIEAEPKLGWDKASNIEIYARARIGNIPKITGSALPEIPKSRLQKLFSEVGDSWRRFDKSDLAGWERYESIESWASARQIQTPFGKAAKTMYALREAMESASGKYRDIKGPTSAEVGNIVRAASETEAAANMNIAQGTGGSAYRQFNEARRIYELSTWLGYAAYTFDFTADFFRVHGMEAKGVTSSSLKRMKDFYQKNLDELIAKKISIERSLGTSTTQKELVQVMEEIEKVTAKRQFAGYSSAILGAGALGGLSAFANGSVSAITNEFTLWLSDTHMLGTATGYGMGYKGLNLMTRSFYRNFDSTYGINERLTNDLAELGIRMRDMDPAQRDALADTITKLVGKRDEMKAVPGLGILKQHPGVNADIWFSQNISLLARMYNIHGDFQLHDEGVISAAIGFYYESDLANNPEVMEKMREGLSGDEAKGYADQMITQHRQAVLGASRVGAIDTQIAEYKDQIRALLKANDVLKDLHDAGMKISRDLGLAADKIETAPDGTVIFQKKTGVNPDGTPIYQNIDVKPVDNKMVARLDAWKAQMRDVTKSTLRNNKLVEGINQKIAVLGLDREAAVRASEAGLPVFREGMVFTARDGTIVTKRRGVTFFETPIADIDGNMVVKTKVLVDKNYLLTLADPANREPGGIAILGEELAHVMAMQDLFQTGRVMFQNALFGKWMQNEHGEMKQVEPPSITGDVDKNIALMDKFVHNYASGMDDGARAAYIARWEHGKNQWRSTKSDFRFLNDALLEMMGQVHVQRLMMNNPQARRAMATGSSIEGGLEMSPILAGNPRWKQHMKFLLGEVTLQDMLTEGTLEKAQALMARIPEESNPQRKARLEADLAEAEAEIQAAGRFLDAYGMGGLYDRLFANRYVSMLYSFGFRDGKNTSPDPMNFWQGSIWDEKTGKDVPIHPSLVASVETGIAMSRGMPGRISANSNIHWENIQAEQNDGSPAANQRRMLFALATGRRQHIDPKTGKWKKSFSEILDDENRPIEHFLKFAAERDKDGTLYGFTPYRNSSGHIKLYGAPNKQQVKRILDYLAQADIDQTPAGQFPQLGGKNKVTREEYLAWWDKYEGNAPFRMNQNTYNNMALILESIARSDIFDNDNVVNGSAGTLPVFVFEYQGVTTGIGPGTTKQRSARNDLPTLRRGAFFAISVEQSTLDVEGNDIAKVTAKEGQNTVGSKDFMYAWFLNLDNLDRRLRDGWEGKLQDKNGETYPWTHAEMSHMFGGNFKELAKAVDITLKNFSHGGPMDRRRTGGAKFPPKRTWEALLEMNEGNPLAAQRMADVVLRIIGFPDNELHELTRLEAKASNQFTPADWILSSSEQKRLAELREKFKDKKVDEGRKFFAELNARHPNEAGAGPMWDTRMVFEKVRIDRIVGGLTQFRNPDGNNSIVSFTPYSQFWGRANFNNAQGWTTLTRQESADKTSTFNLQGYSIVEGVRHETGYSAFLLQKPGKKSTYKGALEWVVFDPKMNKVEGTYEFKADAFNAAEKHNAANPIDRTASLANQFEKDMVAGGFLPSGQSVWLGKRTSYVSRDGYWRVDWNQESGMWDLYNHTNDLLVKGRINLKKVGGDKKVPGADVGELMANIKNAVDNNVVETLLTKREHKRLDDLGVMQWRRVTNADGTTTQVRRFDNNKAYWRFKAYVGKIYGSAEANALAERMVAELGEKVVESDQSATLQWIYKWKTSAESDISRLLNPEESQKTAREENAAARARFMRDLGKNVDMKELPPKPKAPPSERPESMTVAEYQALQDEFVKLSKEYQEAVDAETTAEQLEVERRAKVEAFSGMMSWLETQIKQQEKFAAQQQFPPVVEGVSPEGAIMANSLAKLRGLIREAQKTTIGEVFANDYGYLIQSAGIRRPRDPFGIKVEFPSLMKPKEGEAKRNLFYIYNPSGAYVGEAETFEEAADMANDAAIGIPAQKATRVLEAIRTEDARQREEDAIAGRYLRSKVPPRSPTRVPPQRR